MATYTVTRDVTIPNTSTLWPDDYIATASSRVDGYANLKSSGKVSLTASVDSDDLVQTCIFVWASKADYINAGLDLADNPDSTWMSSRNQYLTYIADNNITARITEEDGTVRVFNSSSKTFEEE